MSEKKIPKGYKRTDVGVIPDDWKVNRLGDAAALERGKFSARPRNDPKYYNGEIPFIQTGDVTNSNGTIRQFSQTLNETGLKVSKLFSQGTLFFTIAANIGDVAFAEFASACPDSLVGITTSFGTEPIWLYHTLKSKKRIFESLATQNAQLNINLEKLKPFQLAIPPVPEQRAIATALSDVDALLAGLDQLIAKKRDLKQAAMQQLLTGQKRLPGFQVNSGYKHSEVGQIPVDWSVATLSALVISGPKNGYSGQSGKDSRGTLTLSLAATSSGSCVLKDDTVKRLDQMVDPRSDLYLKPGDVLVQRSNTIELVGMTSIFSGPRGEFIYPDLMMRLRFKSDTFAHFFWRYANSRQGRHYFKSVAAGSTGTMPKLSGDALRNMPVPNPSLPEQSAITSILSDMDSELTALEQRRDKTRALKQGMMQELLTGKTRLI